MNLGQLIRQQRNLKGYTQEQLGNMIGVSKMAISKYERNIIDNIERKKIKDLSRILDIPIVKFLEEGNNCERITPDEFATEVIQLLDKTDNLSDQQKQHLISTLNFLRSEEK